MTDPARPIAREAALPKGVVAIVVLIFFVLVALRIRRYATASSNRQSMPATISEETERRLFQTPQGLYTTSDIAANGDELPSEKFRDFVPTHDFQPRAGDRLCPVTRTRGNPDCTWVVGGQRYEFCCPPCIAEFVQMAKQNPDVILPAEAYVKGSL